MGFSTCNRPGPLGRARTATLLVGTAANTPLPSLILAGRGAWLAQRQQQPASGEQ